MRSRLSIAVVTCAAGFPAAAQFLEPDVDLLYTIAGVNGEFTGFVANPVGDLNGDGASELLLGAPYYAVNRGRANLHDGATGALLRALEHTDNGYFDGASVRGTGDINGDGVPDFAVGGIGAPFGTGNAVHGRVTAYSGADYSVLWVTIGEAPDDAFGYSVAGLLDDYDGDGFNDVLATATRWDSPTQNNRGRLYILSGVDGTLLTSFDGTGRAFGSCVISVDDVNGDRRRDIAVGARLDGPNSRGRVYIIRTETPALAQHHVIEGLPTSVAFGLYFTDSQGDVNADGVNDLYVSDFNDNGGTGRGRVFSGVDFSTLLNIPARAAGEGFGIGRFCGDVNADGHDDLYLAGWTNAQGAAFGGKGYVISGADGSTLRTTTCTVPRCTAGYDAAGIGDVNGDGAPDFMITGTGVDAASANRGDGAAFIIAGIRVCAGDLSGSSDPNAPLYGRPDGNVDAADFFYYLDLFGSGNLDADLTGSSDPNAPDYGAPDGVLDTADFFYYLDLFVIGCR